MRKNGIKKMLEDEKKEYEASVRPRHRTTYYLLSSMVQSRMEELETEEKESSQEHRELAEAQEDLDRLWMPVK